jgi:hypothetical protein
LNRGALCGEKSSLKLCSPAILPPEWLRAFYLLLSEESPKPEVSGEKSPVRDDLSSMKNLLSPFVLIP